MIWFDLIWYQDTRILGYQDTRITVFCLGFIKNIPFQTIYLIYKNIFDFDYFIIESNYLEQKQFWYFDQKNKCALNLSFLTRLQIFNKSFILLDDHLVNVPFFWKYCSHGKLTVEVVSNNANNASFVFLFRRIFSSLLFTTLYTCTVVYPSLHYIHVQ